MAEIIVKTRKKAKKHGKAKKSNSTLKTSKNYIKPYKGQG